MVGFEEVRKMRGEHWVVGLIGVLGFIWLASIVGFWPMVFVGLILFVVYRKFSRKDVLVVVRDEEGNVRHWAKQRKL